MYQKMMSYSKDLVAGNICPGGLLCFLILDITTLDFSGVAAVWSNFGAYYIELGSFFGNIPFGSFNFLESTDL